MIPFLTEVLELVSAGVVLAATMPFLKNGFFGKAALYPFLAIDIAAKKTKSFICVTEKADR